MGSHLPPMRPAYDSNHKFNPLSDDYDNFFYIANKKSENTHVSIDIDKLIIELEDYVNGIKKLNGLYDYDGVKNEFSYSEDAKEKFLKACGVGGFCILAGITFMSINVMPLSIFVGTALTVGISLATLMIAFSKKGFNFQKINKIKKANQAIKNLLQNNEAKKEIVLKIKNDFENLEDQLQKNKERSAEIKWSINSISGLLVSGDIKNIAGLANVLSKISMMQKDFKKEIRLKEFSLEINGLPGNDIVKEEVEPIKYQNVGGKIRSIL